MWTPRYEDLSAGRARKVILESDSSPLAYAEVLRLWRVDPRFREFFATVLRDVSYPAFRWETPPITVHTVTRSFEFVVLDAPILLKSADPEAFASHFATAEKASGVVAFSNLSGDARMVVPCPRGDENAYPHLAAFVRQAPPAQVDALWQRVGAEVESRLSDKPIWLSTAGAGVAWLHVRLDSRPKYYGYRPYRELA